MGASDAARGVGITRVRTRRELCTTDDAGEAPGDEDDDVGDVAEEIGF